MESATICLEVSSEYDDIHEDLLEEIIAVCERYELDIENAYMEFN